MRALHFSSLVLSTDRCLRQFPPATVPTCDSSHLRNAPSPRKLAGSVDEFRRGMLAASPLGVSTQALAYSRGGAVARARQRSGDRSELARRRCLECDFLERQLAFTRVHIDAVAGADLAGEQRQREAADKLLLDPPSQWTGAVCGVIAEVADQLACVGGERHLHAPLGHALDHERDLQVDDL